MFVLLCEMTAKNLPAICVNAIRSTMMTTPLTFSLTERAVFVRYPSISSALSTGSNAPRVVDIESRIPEIARPPRYGFDILNARLKI